ncbi:MAG TPA: prenyltransferase/squalene oxidase repeat-containing protein [Aliidongia sp.]|uniref:prenyltransferase/squalene oxidase repeat-containing protein n=1 Tax=Aliidongia sp. TaxID=1914230 RepID=UPI002DDCCEA6|nr:prenyltransferase/squalene oxidase repeat-containing protein [Aliidongia sp.]HEV2677170.1 prenyltransferase/squalene oxidase repeat-containing protein [Aliidongia sp.]
MDLHQLLNANEISGSGHVLDHLDALSHAGDGGAAARLHRFLDAWARGNAFGTVFRDIYLEYDLPDGEDCRLARVPGIFLDVHNRSEDPRDRAAREALMLDAVARLRGGLEPEIAAKLSTCFAAAARVGSIGHLGVMVGRVGSAIRVNIKDLGRDDLLPLLEAIGWPGDRPAALEVFARMLDEVDLVTVALDLDGDWQPSLGVEAFINRRRAADPRWRRLFELLTGEGLCLPAEAQALLSLGGRITPGTAAPPWPASWAVAAMLAPRDRLASFQCALTHVKVTLDGKGARQAKVYVGMHHEWQLPAARAATDDRSRPASALPSERLLSQAMDRALDFLAARRRQGGFWRDFDLSIGESDEWVTGFIACQLALAGQERGRSVAEQAIAWLLRRQRPSGGWGYNAVSPPDADSTAWVLHLAAALGIASPALEPAKAFLAEHFLPDGGVATYGPATPIRLDDRVLTTAEAAGWRQGHDCVLANVAPLFGGDTLARLRRRHRPDGAWTAYWWDNDIFATALAVDSLNPADDAAAIAAARTWCLALDPASLSTFDLAWVLRPLLNHGPAVDGMPALTRLLQLQERDGGWPAGAPLLHVLPHQTDRDGAPPKYIDQERCFTTASALATLALARRAIEPVSHRKDR